MSAQEPEAPSRAELAARVAQLEAELAGVEARLEAKLEAKLTVITRLMERCAERAGIYLPPADAPAPGATVLELASYRRQDAG